MAKYVLTHQAVADLSSIWEYTCEKWSENQSDKYYSILLNTCNLLANNPEFGKKYDDIVQGVLGFRINKHIIFYQIFENQRIEIIRILHVSMDLGERMDE